MPALPPRRASALASWGIAGLVSQALQVCRAWIRARLNVTVLLFALGVTVLTALVSGSRPRCARFAPTCRRS